MARACSIIIVPEDQEHKNLAGGYLYERGVQYHVAKRWTGKNGNFDRVREWFISEVRLQAKGLRKFGVIALIDEDGQGPAARRQRVASELEHLGLPSLDSSQGRLLVLPVRNVETWMVWGARWTTAGRPISLATPVGFPAVDEAYDYKRWQTCDGQSLPHESRLDAFQVGRAIATLNPTAPPPGLPPALEAILRPWGDFLDWARR